MTAAESYDVRARRLFGGMGVYTGNRMFAFLIGEDIGLKLSPEDCSAAMQIPGAGPIRPEPDAEPFEGYVKIPSAVLDNKEEFKSWLEKSTAYAQHKVLA